MSSTLDDKTKVPLGIAVGACALVASGAFWLAMLTGSVSTATDKNREQDSVLELMGKNQTQILSDLRLIKAKLKVKEKPNDSEED